MAKEKKSSNISLVKFLGATAACLLGGYLLSLAAMWVYQTYLTGVNLGFGESILLLGFMACGVYTLTGLAIALSYRRFME